MTRARQFAIQLGHAKRAAMAPHASRSCTAVTCNEIVTPGRLFCPNHWFFLPKWLRDAIWTTFNDGELDAYQEAVCQAVDHIDAAFVEAANCGFSGVISARDEAGEIVRFAGRRT